LTCPFLRRRLFSLSWRAEKSLPMSRDMFDWGAFELFGARAPGYVYKRFGAGILSQIPSVVLGRCDLPHAFPTPRWTDPPVRVLDRFARREDEISLRPQILLEAAAPFTPFFLSSTRVLLLILPVPPPPPLCESFSHALSPLAGDFLRYLSFSPAPLRAPPVPT